MLKVYILLISCCAAFIRDDMNSEKLLRKMYDRYQGKWYRNYTFVQTTESYKNDTVENKTTWYEAVSFPDKFRIDFGDPSEGNAVIFRNDSVYSFQKGQLKAKGLDRNDLTFLLGGLYFSSFDEALKKIASLHYDLSRFHSDTWKGKDVYVIGAISAGEKVNQLWIDKEKLVLVRMIKFDDKRKEEGLFENHVKLEGGWTETQVIFYVNDQLVQKEYYHDYKVDPSLDPAVFDPSTFGKVHWYK
ncbi:MAG TPA: hypothetical protein VK543_05890 [Puia sp.]|nr:hypothetical protein [Puia sp.]